MAEQHANGWRVSRHRVCRAAWEDILVQAADRPGDAFVFRPGRASRHAKNLFSSWTARHRPTGGLPAVSGWPPRPG